MSYLLLIYSDESALAHLSDAEQAALVNAWFDYAAELEQSGCLRGAAALHATTTATTVRRQAGRILITDGPFAETKEQLTGFFTIEAADLDAALAWADRMPHLRYGGSTEIRPIRDVASLA